jgi:hypothetical protein
VRSLTLLRKTERDKYGKIGNDEGERIEQ